MVFTVIVFMYKKPNLTLIQIPVGRLQNKSLKTNQLKQINQLIVIIPKQVFDSIILVSVTPRVLSNATFIVGSLRKISSDSLCPSYPVTSRGVLFLSTPYSL